MVYRALDGAPDLYQAPGSWSALHKILVNVTIGGLWYRLDEPTSALLHACRRTVRLLPFCRSAVLPFCRSAVLHFSMSALGTGAKCRPRRAMSEFGGKAEDI